MPDGLADLRCAAPYLGFDGVERGDWLDGRRRDGRGVREMDLVELTAGVGPACVRVSLGKGEVM